IQLDPQNTYPYDRLGGAFMATNRFDEARNILQQAVSRKADSLVVHSQLFMLAFLRGDETAMARELAGVKPEEATVLMMRRADSLAAGGKLKPSSEAFRASEASARRNNLPELIPLIKNEEALHYATAGDCSLVEPVRRASRSTPDESESRADAALTMAQCGYDVEAEKLIDMAGKARPLDTFVHEVRIPLVKALRQMQRGDAAAAVQILEP